MQIYSIRKEHIPQQSPHQTQATEAFELMNCNFSASIEAGFLHFFKHLSLDISASLVKQANSKGRP